MWLHVFTLVNKVSSLYDIYRRRFNFTSSSASIQVSCVRGSSSVSWVLGDVITHTWHSQSNPASLPLPHTTSVTLAPLHCLILETFTTENINFSLSKVVISLCTAWNEIKNEIQRQARLPYRAKWRVERPREAGQMAVCSPQWGARYGNHVGDGFDNTTQLLIIKIYETFVEDLFSDAFTL